jgi:hypothetical protein
MVGLTTKQIALKLRRSISSVNTRLAVLNGKRVAVKTKKASDEVHASAAPEAKGK